MAIARLWDRWRSDRQVRDERSLTIITIEPSKFAAHFHNRMPVSLRYMVLAIELIRVRQTLIPVSQVATISSTRNLHAIGALR
jgi:hypothetical protein